MGSPFRELFLKDCPCAGYMHRVVDDTIDGLRFVDEEEYENVEVDDVAFKRLRMDWRDRR